MADSVVLREEDVPGAKLSKDPSECTVEELKRWLNCHGLKKCGRKGELVERVRLASGKVKVDPKIDAGQWYEMKKKSICPITANAIGMSFPQSGWKQFPSQNIPTNFNYGHVYYYLIESIESVLNGSNNDCHALLPRFVKR